MHLTQREQQAGWLPTQQARHTAIVGMSFIGADCVAAAGRQAGGTKERAHAHTALAQLAAVACLLRQQGAAEACLPGLCTLPVCSAQVLAGRAMQPRPYQDY